MKQASNSFGDINVPGFGNLETGPFVGEIPQPFGDMGMPPCKGYIDQTGFTTP